MFSNVQDNAMQWKSISCNYFTIRGTSVWQTCTSRKSTFVTTDERERREVQYAHALHWDVSDKLASARHRWRLHWDVSVKSTKNFGQLQLCLHYLTHLDADRMDGVRDTVNVSLKTQSFSEEICPTQLREVHSQRDITQSRLTPLLLV